MYKGQRCNGTSQHCIYPKHLQKNLVTKYEDQKFQQSCSDKSDLIFPLGSSCPEEEDGGRCQESCASPGPGCSACSAPSFFLCPGSGQCVPEELRCDGHPQCSGGEDEDLQHCHDIYAEKKIVSKDATHPCESTSYAGKLDPNPKSLSLVC